MKRKLIMLLVFLGGIAYLLRGPITSFITSDKIINGVDLVNVEKEMRAECDDMIKNNINALRHELLRIQAMKSADNHNAMFGNYASQSTNNTQRIVDIFNKYTNMQIEGEDPSSEPIVQVGASPEDLPEFSGGIDLQDGDFESPLFD